MKKRLLPITEKFTAYRQVNCMGPKPRYQSLSNSNCQKENIFSIKAIIFAYKIEKILAFLTAALNLRAVNAGSAAASAAPVL